MATGTGNPRGHPLKLNDEVMAIICDAVREGCYYTVAAARCAHHDLYGHAVGSQVTLPPASGLVLLNG